jgi:methylmalonyl-CoA mutase N-terminal domain/subunit
MNGPSRKLALALERWRREVLAPATKDFETGGADLCTPLDVLTTDEAYLERIGFPGEPPFTRGVQATMYRGRLWTMRQYAGFGTAEESNRRYRYLLSQGQTGLSVAFDLPTQMGFDSDHPRAKGEVGRVGVAIDSREDMDRLLADLPLDRVSTSMTINATAPILLALYVAVGDARGVARNALRGTVQNDILKEYVARGTYIFPPEPSLRLFTDLLAWCVDEVPRWNAISVSGYHMREAGCTAVQEVAFTIGNAIAYAEAARARGMDFDAFAPQVSFFFNVHSNLLEEVAKFRAARRLWSDLTRSRFGAKTAKARAMRFHCQTAGATLTAQQPHVNVVRVAYQALAAVLGGAQSLHTNGFDEALSLPTQAAATLALRTQQVLAHESGVADVVDPLGGAWAVEAATDRIESEARAILARIDEMGGMVRAIEAGWVQREIQAAAYAEQLAIEEGRKTVVGVNAFADDGGAEIPEMLRVDPALEEAQSLRVRALRDRRDPGPAERCKRAVSHAAKGDGNVMPAIVEAVKADVTLGEIADALREVFGEHGEIRTV